MCLPLLLSNSLLSFTPVSPSRSIVYFSRSPSPVTPCESALGQEINDGREALAVSDFLLSKLNCLSRDVFYLWMWSWCQVELLCYHWIECVYYTKGEKKNIHYASNKKYWKTTKTQVMELMWTHFLKCLFKKALKSVAFLLIHTIASLKHQS